MDDDEFIEPEPYEHYMKKLPDWQLVARNTILEKSFKFKNFINAFHFVEKVVAAAEISNHHPDVMFGWGYATIQFTTHDKGGLTEDDFDMAAEVEKLRREF